MATTTLNTRLQLKYDTYKNWTDNNPVPLKGELCIVEVPASTGASTKEPAILFKVGDGTKAFNTLDFTAGYAADVYDWAKAQTKPEYQATEIKNLDSYISGKVQDTNTTYQIVKVNEYSYKLQSKELNGEWADVIGGTITIPKYDDTALSDRVDALEGLVGETAVATQIANAIAALKTELIGTDSDIATSNTIKGAKKYADSLNAAMDSRVDALEEAVGTGGSVDSKITAAIGKLDKSDTAVDGQVVSAVSETDGVITVSRRALVETDIPTLSQSKVNGLATSLAGKQDTLVFNSAYDASTNKAATMADVTEAVGDLSGAMHFEGVKESIPENSEGYSSGDVILVGNKEYVFDGETWHELGDESIYAVKGSIVNADIAANAAIAQSKIANLTADLGKKANTADLGTMAGKNATDYVAKTEAPGYSDILTKTSAATTYATIVAVGNKVDKIKGKGLSTNDYTTAEKNKLGGIAAGAQVNVIESIKVNGQAQAIDSKGVNITVPTGALASKSKVAEADLETTLASKINGKANASDLADIATSGNVNDLIQTPGDLLILNCGSATANI
jgi:hypothetical protein